MAAANAANGDGRVSEVSSSSSGLSFEDGTSLFDHRRGTALSRETTVEVEERGRGPLRTRRRRRDRTETFTNIDSPVQLQPLPLLPKSIEFGQWFGRFICKFAKTRPWLKTCVRIIKRGKPEPFPDEVIQVARLELAEALGRDLFNDDEVYGLCAFIREAA